MDAHHVERVIVANLDFTAVEANQQIKPEAVPIAKAPIGPTSPEAGVIAAKPAMAPVTAPKTLAFPCFTFSHKDQTIVAVAAEMCVTTNVWAAPPSATNPLPALNPNQPTQSIPVPGHTSAGYG